MNETIKSLLERRSIRKFKPDPISKELIELIVKTGRYAATGKDSQIWHFTVVSNQDILDNIVKAYKRAIISIFPDDLELILRIKDPDYSNFFHAPVVIFISGKSDSVYKLCDCANATQNMAVAAYSLGIGSCYNASVVPAFHGHDEIDLRTCLQIPDGYEVVFALALGYPDEPHPEPTPKKENIVNFID